MIAVRIAVAGLALAWAALAHGAGEFTFDASEFRKRPVELSGYVELKLQHFRLNQDGALYLLNFHDEPRSTLDQSTLTFKPTARLHRGALSFSARAHLEGDWQSGDFTRTTRFDEFFLSWKPDPGFTLDAGKIAQKWGKGYAWNPVAFIERAKDPNDPELAREGFTMLAVDWISNFDGPLRTLAFTPVILPASPDLNPDFGSGRHVNAAAKLYLLYYDTDIDFMLLSNGSRSRRYGVDFSRNITSNLEVHGELARIDEVQRQVPLPTGGTMLTRGAATSWLVGARYLTENDTTWIVEYYRNGTGLSEDEMSGFVRLIDAAYAQFLATGSDAALDRAANVVRGGYGRPNPGRNYLYLRVSQKEPFDILYFTPSVTVIANADDRSSSVMGELLYSGFTNVELRLRAFFLNGGAGTEFGEKQNSRRVELQGRLYF